MTWPFGQAPGTWSPYTYDSLNFLADGVEEAGDAAPENRQPATVVIVETDADGQLHVDREWAEAVGAPYRK